ncbi:hypothetical protein CEUSTIGMA_g899.t1 [Chlamydomonas eustigma]|uniref:L-seryl-tRNA(Sec) kinase n=1 Tax=Chlamydomonas eustigma TaxID=1157962 RepID=A0A250WRH2_9CHLO|nr:hypothetical protein CEUSTIGMA_g899.t1 [Chlamydomonas eustigma]|eukprot:GAX73447.1 hypothetical protein CEUSTIGMA_g899.t1 [Chlamydomonas eustigma]
MITNVIYEGKNPSVCILVLCGLPGCGKTTLSKGLVSVALADKTENFHVVHLNFDDLLLDQLDTAQTHFSPEEWKSSRQTAFSRLEAIVSGKEHHWIGTNTPCSHGGVDQHYLHGGMDKEHVPYQPRTGHAGAPLLIVVDDNMQYRSMRYRCYQIARKYNAAFLQIYMECPLQLSLQRNAARSGASNHTKCIEDATRQDLRVPDASILRMATVLEPPNSTLNPWESCVLTCSALEPNNTALWLRVLDWVNTSWSQYPPNLPLIDEDQLQAKLQEARSATAASMLHQLDVHSRAQLSDLLSETPDAMKRDVATKMNCMRRQMLEECKKKLAEPFAGEASRCDPSEVFSAFLSKFKAVLSSSLQECFNN